VCARRAGGRRSDGGWGGAGCAAESQGKVDRAEAAFEESDLLANLLAKTEANRDSNTKAIEEKYCQRGAEWGVGDCGGLQLIPGMTKSGKQKLPFGLGE